MLLLRSNLPEHQPKQEVLYLQSLLDYSWSAKYLHRRFKLIDQDWDRAWQFGCLINGRLTIFPSKNLITSVGQDEFATHNNPRKWDRLPLEEMKFPLKHPKIIVADNRVDNFLTKEGFSKPDIMYRIKNKLRKYLLS